MVTARFLVTGRVQGVGYRAFAWNRALALGLEGYAANLVDGTVEVVARGAKPAVDSLEESLRLGPPWSRVTAVSRTEVSDELDLPTGFETR